VSAPPDSVQTPPQAPFKCPLDQPAQSGQSSSPSPAGATPTAPKSSVGLPGHQIAAEASAANPVISIGADVDFAKAVTVHGGWGNRILASIVIGAGLIWVLAVMSLTCILIRRSYRLEIASPPYARKGEPRVQFGQLLKAGHSESKCLS